MLKGLRSRFGHNFELVRWIIFVFVAGAINGGVLEGFGHYLLHVDQIIGHTLTLSDWPLLLIVPGILVVLTPLFLSLFLTQWKPEKQLIPPLYIQLIALGWFAGFMIIRYPANLYPFLVVEGFYAFVWGAVLNVAAEYLIGVSVKSDDFVLYSLGVNASTQRIKEILEEDKYRQNLDLDWGSEVEDRPNEFQFDSDQTTYGYVLQVVPADKSEESVISAAFYDRADWYVRPPDDVMKEYARSHMTYLKDILAGSPYSLKIEELPASNADSIRSEIVQNMQGTLPQFETISGLGWLKVGGFVVFSAIILVYAFYLKDYPTTIGFIVLLLVSLIFTEFRSSRKGKNLA